MRQYHSRPLESIKPLDTLPPDRIETALMMLRFLRGYWRLNPRQPWSFCISRIDEQSQALRDLAAAGFIVIQDEGLQIAWCTPVRKVVRR